jgi:branched-chain amino acid aminotransferase
MIAYVDGTWSASDEARISVLDHGLLYGDGVFEGIRFYGRKAFLLDAHLTRLEASARALVLELPMAREETAAVVQEAIDRTGLADGYIRLIVTRGVGALGVSPHTCPHPSVVVIAAPLAIYPEDAYRDGVVVVTSSLRRAAADALPPQVKTLNYLTSVLASIECRRQGAHEALLLNAQGLIAECTADNVFLVSGGTVRTPAIAHGALAGITRRLVVDLARQVGVDIVEAELTVADAWTADEIFLTGTGAEIVPVRELDGRAIGVAGRPVTETVRLAFRRYIDAL